MANKITLSKEKPFECSVSNGEQQIDLSVEDLVQLHNFYCAGCTAEYITENYGIKSEDAMKLGYDVRELMSDKKLDEEEAIEQIFAERGIGRG